MLLIQLLFCHLVIPVFVYMLYIVPFEKDLNYVSSPFEF